MLLFIVDMLDPKTLSDLNKAFQTSKDGFLIVEQGTPRFAVLDYETYRSLKSARARARKMKKMKKILVTGGAGYIGSVTVRVLQEQGYEVVVYDNLSTGRREAVKNCKLVVADLASRASLEKVFEEEKIDAVLHFAAAVEVEESVRNPAKYFENNVASGLILLDTMVSYGVNKIVFSSSAAVYGASELRFITEDALTRPSSPYGETKLIFENTLKWYSQAYGIHSVSLRYFNAAGAWPEEALGYKRGLESHLIPRVLDVAAGRRPEIEIYGQDYPTPDGTCVRDYVHVLDLAEAHAAALRKLEQANGAYVYNLGTGKGYSVSEIIDQAVEITGRMIPIKVGPRRAGDPAQLVAAGKRAEKDLSFRPERDLQSILKSSWDWHRTKV